MNSFYNTQKPWMIFADLLLLLVLFFFFKPASKSDIIPLFKRKLGVFFIILFCLFSFWGTDWFHYLDYYIQQKRYPFEKSHIEDVYAWISFLAPNYIVFRLMIWGVGLLLLRDAINRIGLDKDLFWLFFVSISLIWFSYSRVSLAMSLMFWGASLIYDSGKRFSLIRLLIGIGAIVGSYYLHKSSIFGITIIAVSLFLSRLNNKTYIFFIILLLVLVYYANSLISDFLLIDIDAEEGGMETYLSSAQGYLGGEKGVVGIGSIIQRVLEITPYYLAAILCARLQNLQQSSSFPRVIKFFINVLLLIVVMSSVFLFGVEANTSVLYIRFMRFGIIPLGIVLAYCWKNQYCLRQTKRIFWIGCFSTLYSVTYTLYNAIVHSYLI